MKKRIEEDGVVYTIFEKAANNKFVLVIITFIK